MALFIKEKISDIIKQWEMWNSSVHQVRRLLDMILFCRAVHCVPITGELGQSSFFPLWGSFSHICIYIFLYERRQIAYSKCINIKKQKLAEIVASYWER